MAPPQPVPGGLSLLQRQVNHAERAQISLSALLLATNWGRLTDTRTGDIYHLLSPSLSMQQIASYELKENHPCHEKQANGRKGKRKSQLYSSEDIRMMLGGAGRDTAGWLRALLVAQVFTSAFFLLFSTGPAPDVGE